MINLGLSAADHAAYEATLRQSHRIKTVIHVHDPDEKVIYTFKGTIVSGSVQVDLTQSGSRPKVAGDKMTAPTGAVRTLDLTILRPEKEPTWLPDSGADDAAFANNFISVKYCVWVDGLSDGPGWVYVPVFWGPITEIDQDGDQFNIKGSGKDVLGLDPCLLWDTVHASKGEKRTDIIRRLLSHQGEARFSLAEVNDKIPYNHSFHRYTQPWKQSVQIAHGGNYQLFYDGNGRARLRPWPKNRVWNFNDGDNGCLLSRPQVSYDISQVRNTIEILGGTPKGSKHQLRYVTHIDSSNPLSPEALARNGQRRWLVHSEQTGITKKAHAEKRANDLLFQYMTTTVDATFDSLVIPHLEEGDRVAVKCGGQSLEFTLTNFTIPLTSGDSMSVGRNVRVSWRKRGKHHDRITYLLGSG